MLTGNQLLQYSTEICLLILLFSTVFALRKGLRCITLELKLAELASTVEDCELRYNEILKYGVNRIMTLSPETTLNLNKAEEILRSAKNLLLLARQNTARGQLDSATKLVNNNFIRGKILGHSYDGSVMTLPKSRKWKQRFDELLISINEELSQQLNESMNGATIMSKERSYRLI